MKSIKALCYNVACCMCSGRLEKQKAESLMPNLGRACLSDAMSVDISSDPLALLSAGNSPDHACSLVASRSMTGSRR